MKRLMLTGVAGFLAACGAKNPGSPPKEAQVVLIAQSSPQERAFADKLAAIHEEWMGTPWTFSGTSQTPKQGSIACGYFVTTTLQQAGIELDRVRHAQAASEKMILTLTAPDTVRRFSNTSLEGFLNSVRNQGEGYYIVGLDNHTGFLRVNREGKIEFIHSGPGRGVVREKPEDAPELAHSRYRVTGKIAGKAGVEPNEDGQGNLAATANRPAQAESASPLPSPQTRDRVDRLIRSLANSADEQRRQQIAELYDVLTTSSPPHRDTISHFGYTVTANPDGTTSLKEHADRNAVLSQVIPILIAAIDDSDSAERKSWWILINLQTACPPPNRATWEKWWKDTGAKLFAPKRGPAN